LLQQTLWFFVEQARRVDRPARAPERRDRSGRPRPPTTDRPRSVKVEHADRPIEAIIGVATSDFVPSRCSVSVVPSSGLEAPERSSDVRGRRPSSASAPQGSRPGDSASAGRSAAARRRTLPRRAAAVTGLARRMNHRGPRSPSISVTAISRSGLLAPRTDLTRRECPRRAAPGRALRRVAGGSRSFEKRARLRRPALHHVTSSLGNARRADVGAAMSTPMDPLLGDQRHEGAALGADRLDKARTHERRGGAVEDDHRRGLEVRLAIPMAVAKIDADVPPQVTSAPASRREQTPRLFVSVDQGQRRELDFRARDPTSSSTTRAAVSGSVVRASASEIAATASSSRPRTETSCSASRARGAARQHSPRSPSEPGRRRPAGARSGSPRTRTEVAADRVPAVEHSRARIAAGIPIHGNIRPSARSFRRQPRRGSRQSLGPTATATAR